MKIILYLITIAQKKKLGKTTLDTLFITDDTKIYLSQYLDKKEIIMLAKIFVKNIKINTNPIITYMIVPDHVHPNFKLTNLKNSILDPSIELIVNYEENWDDTINDEQLHFELFFIFICIWLTNKQKNVLFYSDFSFLSIDLKIYQKSFNTIIKGLKQNIIIKLTINSCMISDEEANVLATALTDNTTLEELYLHQNNIGDEGAKAIAQVLETNKTLKLKILGINKNKIGDEGATAIAQVLETNTNFDKLYLRQNNIGDEGAKAIAQVLETNKTLKLKILCLNENRIGMEGTTALVTALNKNTTLVVLDLGMLDITDEQYNILKKIIYYGPKERLVLRVRQ